MSGSEVVIDVSAFHAFLFDLDLIAYQQYIERYGEDMPEVRDWTWSQA